MGEEGWGSGDPRGFWGTERAQIPGGGNGRSKGGGRESAGPGFHGARARPALRGVCGRRYVSARAGVCYTSAAGVSVNEEAKAQRG